MSLNSTGPIRIGGSTTGESINLEDGRSATATTSLNEFNIRRILDNSAKLTDKSTISLGEFRGKSKLATITNFEYFILAGAGGGGFGFDTTASYNAAGGAGGGGAGGMRTGFWAAAYGDQFAIIVGAGGAAAPSYPSRGGFGDNSTIYSYSSSVSNSVLGGGGGGTRSASNSIVIAPGEYGGCGGGAAAERAGGSGWLTPDNSYGGNALVEYGDASVGDTCGGGGGGLGGPGQTGIHSASADGTILSGGRGGPGIQSNFSGTTTWYGAGGGGGAIFGFRGIGGEGSPAFTGQGASSSGQATAGGANVGGGGGGGGYYASGANGGSGVIIIRYPNTFYQLSSITGPYTYQNTGGYRIYTFTGTSVITV